MYFIHVEMCVFGVVYGFGTVNDEVFFMVRTNKIKKNFAKHIFYFY